MQRLGYCGKYGFTCVSQPKSCATSNIVVRPPRSIWQAAVATLAWANASTAMSQSDTRRKSERFIRLGGRYSITQLESSLVEGRRLRLQADFLPSETVYNWASKVRSLGGAHMMEGGMGSMHGWMIGLGGLIALLLVIVLIAAIVALVRLAARPHAPEQASSPRGTVVKVIVIVLAVIGALTLAGVAAGLVMHAGMMSVMGRCA